MAYLSNADRRIQFIKAASKVIREHGVARATTRSIAEEAGAPLASLHYCFRGKEELFEEVSKTIGTAGKQAAADKITSHMGLSQAVKAIFDSTAAWMVRTAEDPLTEIEFYIWAIRGKNLKHLSKRYYRDWIVLYKELLVKASKPKDPPRDLDSIARMILALVDGALLQEQFIRDSALTKTFKTAANLLTGAIERGDFDLK
jgi:TetR/AcrR family transcriptional regulator, regulator of biofilm formation and stress response